MSDAMEKDPDRPGDNPVGKKKKAKTLGQKEKKRIAQGREWNERKNVPTSKNRLKRDAAREKNKKEKKEEFTQPRTRSN